MFAVIETGGKQYRVIEGQKLRVEKLLGDVGAKVDFDRVLMVGGDKSRLGVPFVAGAKVTAEITVQDRDKKIIVFKMKRRKRYRRKNGHRQPFTEIKVTSIDA